MPNPKLFLGVEWNIILREDRIDDFNTLRAKLKMKVAAGISEDWEDVLSGFSTSIFNHMITIGGIYKSYMSTRHIGTIGCYIGTEPEAWLSALSQFIKHGHIGLLRHHRSSRISIYAYKDSRVYLVTGKSDILYHLPIIYKYDEKGNWVFDDVKSVPDHNYLNKANNIEVER